MSANERLLHATVPGLPPSTWSAYVRTHQGKAMAPKARQWQEDAMWCCRAAWSRETYTGPCALHLVLYCRGRGRWDLDNRVKLVQDALQKVGVVADDSQILALTVQRVLAREDRTDITLTEMEEWPTEQDVQGGAA